VNKPEVARLIGYISAGFDNRKLSEATVDVWAEELAEMHADDALQAVRNHFRKPSPRDYLSLDVLLEQIRIDTRQTPTAIEEDVRSAKARGLIEASWPKRDPLPRPVAEQLARARAEFAETAAAIEAGVIDAPRALTVGAVGQPMPQGEP
jgi:hypothetical protein